ncbi:hypothetical protein SAMN05421753_119111 [Planctomicrobium piriforme]|uniref:Uncharacterized protein n=1 Tax=Planctomicrobium piriforme TaxID=1576369 RepID=A0A1I3R0E5_9PLAN|nr:hypothetical protein SAMN05421753_119111 [Planctomicrobium piriforme]
MHDRCQSRNRYDRNNRNIRVNNSPTEVYKSTPSAAVFRLERL